MNVVIKCYSIENVLILKIIGDLSIYNKHSSGLKDEPIRNKRKRSLQKSKICKVSKHEYIPQPKISSDEGKIK